MLTWAIISGAVGLGAVIARSIRKRRAQRAADVMDKVAEAAGKAARARGK
jgi:hypothetical protein